MKGQAGHKHAHPCPPDKGQSLSGSVPRVSWGPHGSTGTAGSFCPEPTCARARAIPGKTLLVLRAPWRDACPEVP